MINYCNIGNLLRIILMEAKQMNSLVQERIKKMVEMKRQAKKDEQNLTKRLKSNNEIESS